MIMKDSGIEWIGQIPSHWGVRRIKNIGKIYNGSTPKSENTEYYDGDIVWITPADMNNVTTIFSSRKTITKAGMDSCGTTLVPKNTIIISTRAPIGLINIAGKELCTNQGCKSVVTEKSIFYKYLYYYLIPQSDNLNNLGSGTTFLELSTTNLSNYKLPFPHISEQQAIADYLDEQCAKIDGTVEKQKQIIEKLKEYKKSLITETVTKGLNPNTPMKDSGIEWIGQIPSHWGMAKLKNYALICNGKDYTNVASDDGEYPVVGSGGVFSLADDFLYNKPSVLLGRKGTIDKPLFITVPFWTVDTMYYTKINENCYAKYFYYLCTTIQFDFYQYGTALPSMTQRDLNSIPFVFPPLSEQLAIANYLDKKCSEIDSVIEKREKMIDLLSEYKKSLIYECVTGKKEVVA